MAHQIKCLWMRIGTMFLTLYFMPLSNFIMSLFGIRHFGEATAGEIICNATSSKSKMECYNTTEGEYKAGDTVRDCECINHHGVYADVECVLQDYGLDEKSNPIVAASWKYIRGTCSPECTPGQTQSCKTSSGTGTQVCDKYGDWGRCNISGCSSGYVMIDNKCYASCNVDNGSGYKRDIYEASSSSTEA